MAMTAAQETPDMARAMGLTPLALWVLDRTCGKPVRRVLPTLRLGIMVPRETEITCMRDKGHADGCSEKRMSR